mmetsp:Transcript_15091/g.41971  ORF Transcript_15091/g.41971 Transcript_15091/m.41971 type:complete len:381 (-) Transcript_15091:680-1822(-)
MPRADTCFCTLPNGPSRFIHSFLHSIPETDHAVPPKQETLVKFARASNSRCHRHCHSTPGNTRIPKKHSRPLQLTTIPRCSGRRCLSSDRRFRREPFPSVGCHRVSVPAIRPTIPIRVARFRLAGWSRGSVLSGLPCRPVRGEGFPRVGSCPGPGPATNRSCQSPRTPRECSRSWRCRKDAVPAGPRARNSRGEAIRRWNCDRAPAPRGVSRGSAPVATTPTDRFLAARGNEPSYRSRRRPHRASRTRQRRSTTKNRRRTTRVPHRLHRHQHRRCRCRCRRQIRPGRNTPPRGHSAGDRRPWCRRWIPPSGMHPGISTAVPRTGDSSRRRVWKRWKGTPRTEVQSRSCSTGRADRCHRPSRMQNHPLAGGCREMVRLFGD